MYHIFAIRTRCTLIHRKLTIPQLGLQPLSRPHRTPPPQPQLPQTGITVAAPQTLWRRQQLIFVYNYAKGMI